MTSYIKLSDPEFTVSEENVKYVLNSNVITPQLLSYHGFAVFKPQPEAVVPAALSQEEKVELWIRRARDYYLKQCDWTQYADSPLTDAEKAGWATYRQSLRDLTDVYALVEASEDVVWPTEPGKEEPAAA